MLVQLADVGFGFPGVELFSGVTWQVDPGSRVGLVGPNGCGKSTLLRLLSGDEAPDQGQVSRNRDCEIGYLRQSHETRGVGTLLEALLAPFERILELRRERLVALEALERDPADEQALQAYGHAQHEYEMKGGDSLEARVKEIVRDLGFLEGDLERPLGSFSGGELGRIELARVLVREPDLLLLDEPTNHLDIEATEALERRLRETRSAVVMVSHDRAFLNAICTEIIEIVGQGLERYRGNFDDYQQERAARMARIRAEIDKQQTELDKLQDYIARNHAGQKARQARSRKRALDKIDRIEIPEDPWARSEGMRLRFAAAEHRGAREMVRIEGLTLAHGDGPPLVEGFDLTVERGDRLGIVGPNGCGKSTLLKALVGARAPQAGTVTVGKQVVLGWFDQQRSDLHEDLDLTEEIRTLRADLTNEQVRGVLGALRFGDQEVFRPVSSLSGGEASRLALGKLATEPHNLLALDEPTNHLDIPAREALEQGILEFPGTLIVVSHDRYFLDRVVTKILWFGPQGVELHWGNYQDLRDRLRRGGRSATAPARADTARAPADESQREDKAARAEAREQERQAKRARERAERRFAELEEQIGALETTLADLDERLAACGDDWEQLQEVTAERQRVEAELEGALGEWEQVGSQLER
jgi:ATP-binding cassette subfamily F protein 3